MSRIFPSYPTPSFLFTRVRISTRLVPRPCSFPRRICFPRRILRRRIIHICWIIIYAYFLK